MWWLLIIGGAGAAYYLARQLERQREEARVARGITRVFSMGKYVGGLPSVFDDFTCSCGVTEDNLLLLNRSDTEIARILKSQIRGCELTIEPGATSAQLLVHLHDLTSFPRPITFRFARGEHDAVGQAHTSIPEANKAYAEIRAETHRYWR